MSTQPTNSLRSALDRAADEQRGVGVNRRMINPDDRVAAEVMGWVWRHDAENWLLPNGEVFTQSLDFTSDPASDLLVLSRVGAFWKESEKAQFVAALCRILHIRVGVDYTTNGTVWLFLFGNDADAKGYLPGDYARAALAVVTASPVPPCLAQQFGGGDATGRQARDTARRCDERASEEDAGAQVADQDHDHDGHG